VGFFDDESFSGFSPDKALTAGIFTQEETDKYIRDWYRQFDGSEVWHEQTYSAQEKELLERFKDAYNNYDDVLARHGGAVKEDLTEKGDPDSVPVGGYDSDTEYIGKPHQDFDEPDNIREWSNESGNGELVVTPEAIEYFCKQLDAVAPQGKDGIIWQAIKRLDAIDIKPGTFGKAVALRNKITGIEGSTSDGGLKGDTRGMLVAVHEALFDLQKNLRTMMVEYEGAENLNSLTGEKFKDVMNETWGDITKFSKYGNTDTNATGNEKEEGGDGDGA
jgi:hypothetical protein